MGKKQGPDKTIICPQCVGYGSPDDGTGPSPCITCGPSGWLTKSELEEWEIEDNPVDWHE